MKACRLLFHECFDNQYLQLVSTNIKASEAVRSQLIKSRDNPTAGKTLRAIVNPALQGKLYRLHVGGPGGFRYVYYYHAKQAVVIPVYLSLVLRSNFSWSDFPFLQDAEVIVNDFRAGRMERFKERVL